MVFPSLNALINMNKSTTVTIMLIWPNTLKHQCSSFSLLMVNFQSIILSLQDANKTMILPLIFKIATKAKFSTFKCTEIKPLRHFSRSKVREMMSEYGLLRAFSMVSLILDRLLMHDWPFLQLMVQLYRRR